MRRTSITLHLLTLALFAVLAPGCLYAGGRTTRETGPQIDEHSVAFIEFGRTSVELLEATFGEPNHRVCTSDGTEILRYDSDIRTTEGSYVLMLVASSNNTIQRTSWWFEVREQKVMRLWGEGFDGVKTSVSSPARNETLAQTDAPAAAVNHPVDLQVE